MARILRLEELEQVKQGDKVEVQAQKQGVSKVKLGEQVIPVKLLTKGKLGYPDVVHVRPLKVRDVKSLVGEIMGEEILYLRRLIDVVQGTVLDEGIDVKQFAMADFKKLLLAHRVYSIGSEIELAYRCSCKDEIQVVKYDLTRLEETEIADDYVEPVEIGDGVYVRLPRVIGYVPEEKVRFDEVTDYDLLSSAVIGANVDDLMLGEAKKAIEFIRRWEGSFGIQSDIEVPCKFCGRKVKVAVPFFGFFLIW